MIHSALPQWHLDGARVLVRADLNVPLDGTTIVSDYKLTSILPTLECIRAKNGSVVLITHLGRPTHPDPALSIRNLIPWFEQHGYPITYAATLEQARITPLAPGQILFLENLRFFPGEKKQDTNFARDIAALGDYFVQDAFGSLHNHDASITLIPTHFPPEKRTIGLLVEKELQELTPLVKNPSNPFIVIIGGGKIASKLPFARAMLDYADTIVLLPGIVFTFLKSLDKPTGLSLVDHTLLEECKNFLSLANEKKVTIITPVDYYVRHTSCTSNQTTNLVEQLNISDIGISCGPHTIEHIQTLCAQAHTIVVNGLMGFIHNPDTLKSMHAILKIVALAPAHSIIGGGDTIAALEYFNMLGTFDHVSTGGGAMLAFMSKQALPGLDFLKSR